MIPILYDRDDIYAVRLGKGKLTEAIRCVVHEELNGEYNLEFDYPITGRLYDELKGRSTVLGYNPRKFSSGLGTTKCQGEYFDIEKATKPIDGIVTFFANHISRRFAEHVCLAGAFHGSQEADYPSDYGKISIVHRGGGTFPTFRISAPKSKLACLIGDEESFVSTSGGEVRFGSGRATIDGINRPVIDVTTTTRIGKDRGASIRFGVNMLNVEHEKDLTGAYNAVVPYWDDGNGNITYADGYVVQPTTPITPVVAVPLDCSNEFETQPTSAQLVAYARDFLDTKTPWTGSETIKVDFINGAEIDPHAPDILLGDTIHVYWGDADIATDLRVVAYDYDVLAERYISLELGTPQTQYVAVTGDSYAGASGGGGVDLLTVYPIGAIYLSTVSVSPELLFGGTWERISGKFLLAATDGGAAGGNSNASIAPGYEGGEAAHTLTKAEMAAHTHGSKSLTGYTRFRRYGTSGSGSDIAGIIGSSGIVSKTGETWSGTHGLVGTGGTNVSNPTVDRITVNATHEHNSVGGGQAHNNMPPYLAVYVWKRTA